MAPDQGQYERHTRMAASHLGMVHAGVTIGFEDVVRRHGGNPARVIAASGLEQALLPSSHPTEITLSSFSALLRAAAQETRVPTFGMEFAESFDVRSFGAIGYLLQVAPDLGTGLKDFCAAFELLQENTEIGVDLHGDMARITYSVRTGTPDEKAPDAEFSVAMLGAALRRGQDASVDVRRLDLEHVPSWVPGAAPAWLAANVRLKADRNAIFVDRSALARPGRFQDAVLYRIVRDRVFDDLRSQRSRSDLVSQVIRGLRLAFDEGRHSEATAPSVARHLGVSERTLHRQLAAHGAKFRDLRNAALLDRAKSLLSDNGCSVTEAAFVLGYSETSAFSRAFQQLSGQSPRQFRKN